MPLSSRNNHIAVGNDKFATLISNVKDLVFHVSLQSPGGIARAHGGARGSAAVRARRSRLAEHGAKRRADGLDGENRVRSWHHRAKPPDLIAIKHLTPGDGSYLRVILSPPQKKGEETSD